MGTNLAGNSGVFYCLEFGYYCYICLVTGALQIRGPKAQILRMQERGEISKDKVKEYEEKTKGDLPERVKAKKKASEYIERKKKSSNG